MPIFQVESPPKVGFRLMENPKADRQPPVQKELARAIPEDLPRFDWLLRADPV